MVRSEKPELQCLAIEQLCHLGEITSFELRNIYETSPHGIVRMMALTKISDYRNDDALAVIAEATQDRYELVQRYSLRLIHESGDDRLIPALIALSIENNTSDRVNFDARQAIAVFPKDKLLAEFARQFDRDDVVTLQKDTLRTLMERTITRYAEAKAEAVAAIDTTTNLKEVKFTIRGQRNDMVHAAVPQLLDYIDNPRATTEVQVMVLEALGWHPQSYQAPLIMERVTAIADDEQRPDEVRAEARKTIRRLREAIGNR